MTATAKSRKFTSKANTEERKLESQLKEELLSLKQCTVSTVDAFQGAERDVIIVTTSRSVHSSGFIDSPLRLNVALTRAKHHLFVVGCLKVLTQNKVR